MRFVQPYSSAHVERIRATGVAVIHFSTGASGFFRECTPPAALFAPLPELKMKIAELLKRTGTRPGHIFNVGHGILPETPVENVKACVEMVREFKP